MAKSSVKKAICEECSVDIRENTAYCYNCGSPVGPVSVEPVSQGNGSMSGTDDDARAALEDLATRLASDESAANDKLARAAAKRKKARFIQRKVNEFEWLPVEESSSRLLTLSTVLIAVITLAIVFLNILWR